MSRAHLDPGSFRDPRGRVHVAEGEVLRVVAEAGRADYERLAASGLLDELAREGLLLACAELDRSQWNERLGEAAGAATHVLTSPRLPFISYPYEWCFSALKAAALAHLELHRRCLAADFTLSDASAYNVQFLGAKPVFIDLLSIRPYREGEIWAGHRQFCEQFLYPLLMHALLGVEPNDWYRGRLEGIPGEALARLIPWRRRLGWNVLKHVVLPAALQRSVGGASRAGRTGKAAAEIRLPRPAMEAMLSSLSAWIERLEPRGRAKTTWADYATDNSYSDAAARAKRDFVHDFARRTAPSMLWDLGCNTGEYARVALDAGARHAVGFDFDADAIESGFRRAARDGVPFLALRMALANPSPGQGWAQGERAGLRERGGSDAVLALALIHHLAIGSNIPLASAVEWLVSLAPRGVIEFVPKADAQVQALLSLREDVFADYSRPGFEAALQGVARVHRAAPVDAAQGEAGRMLYWFERDG